MGFFDNFKEKAADLAQASVAQSKRLAEIAKLKTANMGEEDSIKKAYIELGKLYYAEKGAAPEAAYAASCEKITAAKAAIEVNNERIAELKAKEDGEEDEIDAVEEAKEEVQEIKEEVVEKAEEVVAEVVEAVEEVAEKVEEKLD
ncbi:MAG: serine proteinase [Clostridium sp.]|nr:serine proteinase [Clostridium sp.]